MQGLGISVFELSVHVVLEKLKHIWMDIDIFFLQGDIFNIHDILDLRRDNLVIDFSQSLASDMHQ